MLLNLNKMRLMRQAEHTFSFHPHLISGSVTYLIIIFTSFFFAGLWILQILGGGKYRNLKIDDKERENKKKKIMATLGGKNEPNFFLQSLHFYLQNPKNKMIDKTKTRKQGKKP